MAKHRFHVNLPNGEKVWLTGETIMGHSDIQITMNRYTHPQELRVMAAVNELAGMFAAKID